MTSVTASLLVVALATGCTAANKQAGYISGGVLTAGGTILFASAAMTDCGPLHEDDVLFNGTGCDIGSGITGGFGALAALSGLAILLASAAAPTAEEPERPAPSIQQPPAIVMRQQLDPQTVQYTATLPPVVPPTNDPTLRNFTQQASMAARTGQCLAVQAIAKRVEDFDPAYRVTGFLGDPLVAACLH